MKKSLAVCFLLVLASAVGADAATITFTSSAAFFAALGATPSTTETYEGLALNSTISAGATVNGITYTNLPVGTVGRIDNTYNRIGNQSLALGGSQAFFFPGQSLGVTFAPTTALGVFFNVNPSALNSLYVQTAVGTAGNGPAYDQSTLYFVGLISDSAFSSATIGATNGASGGYNLDNISRAAGAAPVPEPAYLILLGSGLIGLKMRQRLSRPL